jgi:hypothetical protein
MTKKTLGLLLVLPMLAGANLAWAGRVNNFETQVDLGARTALGSLYDTRRSADNVQYIGCYLNLIAGAARLTCEAKDAASESLTCSSANAELIKIAQSLGGDSYIYFQCDASNALTYLYVSNNSVWLP